MTVGSDNPFQSVLFVEGTTPANPAAGRQRLFVDTADSLLKLVDETGAVTTIGAGSSDLDAIITASSGQDIADALAGATAPDATNVFATLADTSGGSLDALLTASSGEDIADALAGAAAPDSGNVFATMADVGGGAPVTLRGSIASNGTINRGSGFTVTKGSTGIYTINFTSSFAATPVFLMHGWTDNSTFSTAVYNVTLSTSSALVRVREAANNASLDGPFDFIAMAV